MAQWEIDDTNPLETSIPASSESQASAPINTEIKPEVPPIQQPLFTPYPQFTPEAPEKRKHSKAGLVWAFIAVTVVSCIISIIAANANAIAFVRTFII